MGVVRNPRLVIGALGAAVAGRNASRKAIIRLPDVCEACARGSTVVDVTYRMQWGRSSGEVGKKKGKGKKQISGLLGFGGQVG